MAPIIQMAVGHDLAGKEYLLQAINPDLVQRPGVGHINHYRGHPEYEIDILLRNILHQSYREGEMLFGYKNQSCPGSQAKIDIQGGIVEIERGLTAYYLLGCNIKTVNRPVNVVNHPTVRYHHPFGNTGGA